MMQYQGSKEINSYAIILLPVAIMELSHGKQPITL